VQRFGRILYVTGEQPSPDPAFRRACRLARGNRAELTLLAVRPSPQRFAVAPGSWGAGWTPTLATLRREAGEKTRRLLDELAGEAAEAGVEARTRFREGRLFQEVIRAVLREGHDLVVKSATGDRSRLRWFFGSDDHHLMRKCPAPVWLLDPDRAAGYRGVLAAVDVASQDERSLNVKILELASSLAELEGAELHVVHAWSLHEERYLRAHESEISHTGLRGLLRAEKEERSQRLEAMVDEVAPSAKVHLRKGDAARIVSLVARETLADVLVMGTLGRSGVPGFLIGNTAESVLARVRCGVLTVKPDGFETPVTLEDAPEGDG
jgi:nucleotide-binding universal stress UspA family protein